MAVTFQDWLPCLEAGACIAIVLAGTTLLVWRLERGRRAKPKLRNVMATASDRAQYAATQLSTHLKSLGVRARLTSEVRKVKRLGNPIFGSEGHCFIDIAGSPIEWIDIAVWLTHASYEVGPNEAIYARYGVPDIRLRVHRPKYSLFLTVRGPIHWKGKGVARTIAERLNAAPELYQPILQSLTSADAGIRFLYGVNPLWIIASPRSDFWLICTSFPQQVLHPSFEGGLLGKKTWRTYERIAEALLHTQLPYEAAA